MNFSNIKVKWVLKRRRKQVVVIPSLQLRSPRLSGANISAALSNREAVVSKIREFHIALVGVQLSIYLAPYTQHMSGQHIAGPYTRHSELSFVCSGKFRISKTPPPFSEKMEKLFFYLNASQSNKSVDDEHGCRCCHRCTSEIPAPLKSQTE